MSLVIDADGHVEETLPELVDAIASAMRDAVITAAAYREDKLTQPPAG